MLRANFAGMQVELPQRLFQWLSNPVSPAPFGDFHVVIDGTPVIGDAPTFAATFKVFDNTVPTGYQHTLQH